MMETEKNRNVKTANQLLAERGLGEEFFGYDRAKDKIVEGEEVVHDPDPVILSRVSGS